jgi:hypothetical protein
MSPVRSTRVGSERSTVLAVSGLVLALVLVLVVFIVAIPNLTSSGTIEVKLGPERFDAGLATDRADEVADRGPILLPDVAGNDRDVYLQHLGDDADTGWLAFDARRPDTTRACTLEWDGDRDEFVDPCDGTVVTAAGDGLPQHAVEVTDDGRVVVDLRAPR